MLNYDLNLLKLFLILMNERSLTKTASKLHLTQPAISRALSRLRSDFEDQLFVRCQGGVLPTPKAISLETPVRLILQKIEDLYSNHTEFDPSIASGVVRIATTDYFEQVAWAQIAASLTRLAPKLKLSTITTGSQIPINRMVEGDIQLAIAGFFEDLPAGFMMQEIFTDQFKCCVRKNHPLTKNGLTIESYLAMGHVIVSPKGDLEGAVDVALRKKNKKRNIVQGVSNFISSGSIVANTDLVLTIPSLFLETFSQFLDLEVFDPPMVLPKIKVVQVWHERFHQDPLLIWVREKIASHCQTLKMHTRT